MPLNAANFTLGSFHARLQFGHVALPARVDVGVTHVTLPGCAAHLELLQVTPRL